MELRGQKTIAILIALAAALPALGEQYTARHEHLRKGCNGTLTIDESGVSFQGPKHKFAWNYEDIQQLELAPRELRVLTYRDNKWKLGADRELRFRGDFSRAYPLLKNLLDQRFVAALADEDVKPLWELKAKHLERFGGSEGSLVFGEDRIVYKAKGDARTWRYTDLDSISSAGPFQLTLTTFERARSHYGSRKAFNFQLKEPLDEERYNDLWRRLNQKKGSIRLPALASNHRDTESTEEAQRRK